MQFISDKLSFVKTHQYLWNFMVLFVFTLNAIDKMLLLLFYKI